MNIRAAVTVDDVMEPKDDLTDEERAARDAHIVAMHTARTVLATAMMHYNSRVCAAYNELRVLAEHYDTVLAEAALFAHFVAQPRLACDDPRSQYRADVRDLGAAWFEAACELETLNAAISPPDEFRPDEADVEDILRDLPATVR